MKINLSSAQIRECISTTPFYFTRGKFRWKSYTNVWFRICKWQTKVKNDTALAFQCTTRRFLSEPSPMLCSRLAAWQSRAHTLTTFGFRDSLCEFSVWNQFYFPLAVHPSVLYYVLLGCLEDIDVFIETYRDCLDTCTGFTLW